MVPWNRRRSWGERVIIIAAHSWIIRVSWQPRYRIVSRSQTLIPREGEGESLIKSYASSCPSASYNVWGATNQIVSLWHYVVMVGVSDCERKINTLRNSISSIHSRICHRKLCNAIKMQSDWSRLIRGAGTTRCTTLYQTLSLPLPRCKSLAARD
jgi:hypothetical protein